MFLKDPLCAKHTYSQPHSQSAHGIIEQRGRTVLSPTDSVGEMEPDTFAQGVKLHARLY